MDPEKVRVVLAMYTARLREGRVNEIPLCSNTLNETFDCGRGQCYDLIDKIGTHMRGGRMQDARDTLRFMQGVLWSNGFYSMDELDSHRIE